MVAEKGDKHSNALIDAHKNHSVHDSTNTAADGGTCRMHPKLGVKKSSDGKALHGNGHRDKNLFHLVRTVLARQVSTAGRDRLIPRYRFQFGLLCETTAQKVSTGNATGVFRAREIRRLEPQSRWDREKPSRA